MPISTAVFRPRPDLVLRKIGDDAIVIPIRRAVGDLDSVFTLNETALTVWGLLDGERSTAEIADAITREYDVDVESAAVCITDLLRTLEGAGLVERVAAAQPV